MSSTWPCASSATTAALESTRSASIRGGGSANYTREEQRPGEWLNFAEQQCRRYGLTANAEAAWLVLQCKQCGNIQIFQFFAEDGPLKNWGLRPRR